MTTAILALQGAFIEHATMLNNLDEQTFEIRQKKDLLRSFDRLILPGGESSVQRKLLHDLGLYNEIRAAIQAGLPTMGTCAGLILLAEFEPTTDPTYPGFATLPVAVERNAYGRQLGSFVAQAAFTPPVDSHNQTNSMDHTQKIPMRFIRAPRITHITNDEVVVLARYHDTSTAVLYHKQIGIAFHPELDSDTTIHKYFLSL